MVAVAGRVAGRAPPGGAGVRRHAGTRIQGRGWIGRRADAGGSDGARTRVDRPAQVRMSDGCAHRGQWRAKVKRHNQAVFNVHAKIGLIAFDYVLRKGTQSNWSEKQARICVLCDEVYSHTALPRVKGMHQPRGSAVFPQNTIATAAGDQRMSIQDRNGSAGSRSRSTQQQAMPHTTASDDSRQAGTDIVRASLALGGANQHHQSQIHETFFLSPSKKRSGVDRQSVLVPLCGGNGRPVRRDGRGW